MALSGVRDQAYTVSQVVEDALLKIYAHEAGQTLDAVALANGIRALRNMLRTWAAQDVNLWLDATQTVTPVAGTATYTLSPRALDVSYAFRRNGGNDTPIRLYTREEYNRLPNKTAPGSPFVLWPDRQRASTVVALYPVPDAQSAANDVIHVVGRYQIQDVTDGAQDIDIPPEWAETLVYNLAVRLGPDYLTDVRPDVLQMADYLFNTMKGQGRERSVYFRPMRYS
jgi:hypothetical protein